ncbi:hypothetical protein [Streptomyces sp. NBC_00569]|uniref:hypothetical protein n=1 Tax=unclassified Streptomyces TaxID=2593676 RepID=UPI002E7FEBBD|nr:hypothetical protein [Streptomyces sp. NBC_00569]WUB91067.1 hypothetical protein OHO83_01335 [Streptomyces sp. NBC_00569]
MLFGWSAYLYASYPDTRQIDLTVISEKHDGRCTVRWQDPYHDGGRRRESAYRCDPDRDAVLKAPNYDPDTGYGWDTGFMFTEGRHRGDLEPSLEEAEPYALSDALVLIGLALIAVGLIGGTSAPRYAWPAYAPRPWHEHGSCTRPPTRRRGTTRRLATPCAWRGARCAASRSTRS